MFINAAILYSLVYDADVLDDDNFVTALENQIQISIELIGTVRNPSKELIILNKQ